MTVGVYVNTPRPRGRTTCILWPPDLPSLPIRPELRTTSGPWVSARSQPRTLLALPLNRWLSPALQRSFTAWCTTLRVVAAWAGSARLLDSRGNQHVRERRQHPAKPHGPARHRLLGVHRRRLAHVRACCSRRGYRHLGDRVGHRFALWQSACRREGQVRGTGCSWRGVPDRRRDVPRELLQHSGRPPFMSRLAEVSVGRKWAVGATVMVLLAGVTGAVIVAEHTSTTSAGRSAVEVSSPTP